MELYLQEFNKFHSDTSSVEGSSFSSGHEQISRCLGSMSGSENKHIGTAIAIQ